MGSIWVVVAESSRARIFSTTGPRAALNELEALTQPEARLKEHDLVADAPGRGFDSGGNGRHEMVRPVDQKQHEAEEFARYIAGHLREECNRRTFEKLILVAPPAFLGLLRKALQPTCSALVAATVNKNLVQHEIADIRDHLPEWF